MLAGRLAGTAPYGWTRDDPDLVSYVRGTIRRLRGSGLADGDLAALASYMSTIAAPPTAHPGGGQVARGREIFSASCASCHSGASFTDGKRHAVGSQAPYDREPGFATPSLLFVGGTAPYFHDGRYATLRELLLVTDGTMGKAKHLAPADVDALEAFVSSL
jgi:mono/diheme cytochrome c family protein